MLGRDHWVGVTCKFAFVVLEEELGAGWKRMACAVSTEALVEADRSIDAPCCCGSGLVDNCVTYDKNAVEVHMFVLGG